MAATREAPARTPPAPPIAKREGPLATGEKFRPYALALLTVVLVGLCAWLAVPLLPAITWGVALAIIAWPLHDWVTRRVTENRTGAAVLSTLVVIAAIVVPGVFVTYHVVREAETAADQVRDQSPTNSLRDRMAESPALARVVAWADRVGVDIDAEARKAVGSATSDITGLAQGSVMAVLQAAVAFFILFHLLRDRTALLSGVRQLLPVTKPEADRVFTSAAGSVHANLHATLVTSVIDGVGGGLVFWAVGLPSPMLWGVVMFVLSFLPILGTFLVWMPAAAYLAATGDWLGAFALVTWGVVSWFVTDNFIYVRIAGEHMRLHQVPTLIAFLGGLALFGAAGMVLGPGILAVTAAVLDVWHRRAVEAAEAAPAPAT